MANMVRDGLMEMAWIPQGHSAGLEAGLDLRDGMLTSLLFRTSITLSWGTNDELIYSIEPCMHLLEVSS